MERKSSEPSTAMDARPGRGFLVRLRASRNAVRLALRATFPAAAWIAVSLSMIGCDDDPLREIDECIEQSMLEGRQAVWIQGVWRITGEGERSGCVESGYNADSMDIRSQAIRVHQQGHYVFLESGQQGRLSNLELSGLVGDRCVHVKSVERTSQGALTFDFGGRFVGASTIQGEFRGKGPAGCESKGQFTVYVDLDPIPASPVVNPPPPDAGTDQQALCDACLAACDLVEPAYVEDCVQGCEYYVCNPGSSHDGGLLDGATDASVDAVQDAPVDAVDEQTDGAQQDVALDAVADGPAEDAPDAVADGPAEDAAQDGGVGDASADAVSEAGEPDSVSYVLWDGNASLDELVDDGDGGCTVAVPRGTPVSFGSLLWLVTVALLARLRRGPARRSR